MSLPRKLSKKERAVISALLQSTPDTVAYDVDLDDLHVVEMADGGMGSLSLIPKETQKKNRSFGKQIVAGEFTDNDGVPVVVTINVDGENRLYELDVWKVDFSPLLSWPDPSTIKIVKQ